MVNHKLCQLVTINEHYFAIDIASILLRFTRKNGRCNKYTLPSSLPHEGTCKSLNVWSANSSLPSLCLNVNCVQSKAIFLNDIVYAFVAATTNRFSCILP